MNFMKMPAQEIYVLAQCMALSNPCGFVKLMIPFSHRPFSSSSLTTEVSALAVPTPDACSFL